ncbi:MULTISPECIES: family 16 glycosylhydrolase [unclassified Novosphingobium]|uniref:glycoside hydrolase family 16 protein n=1 Tax=unclassified Novosphingobium TaxID=2644732 RepID=UPI000D301656|nr:MULTISPECIES: glycoside hydrolase family 16 protein [unclassified Novosphingobium]PTR10322.1 beta-glucanase (GH16 family) [Novosphingobium sp. GV055]PUB02993.1 beta-glucanase (GH16 family) [Novosphingobium sp. GV061]PUB19654.1 beta-glucanase (GH16 family) [Novosphingobium sp. GV079]PUB41293.1 beta-glucanase (GH16 family) [Novosphingobium sp. GV027]
MSLALVLLAAGAAATTPANAAPLPPGPGWHLVWADEFNGTGIDPTRWTLADDCWGGGNQERQCYTPRASNAHVAHGQLVITARKEAWRGPTYPQDLRDSAEKAAARAEKPFTSARLSTKGKAAWRYGRVEVRAKLPGGQGSWPAIWMLPAHDRYGHWAASGEIDILETVNLGVPCAGCTSGREDHALGTIHFGGVPPANRHVGSETPIPAPVDGYHVYAVDWAPGAITWSIDGVPYETRHAGEWSTTGSADPLAPFDQPFYLVLNLAIGGGLPESRNGGGVDSSGFPRTMMVDWVHVWQSDAAAAAPAAAQ